MLYPLEAQAIAIRTGLAYGGGIGVVIGRTRLQIEYTFFADDAEQLTLGLQF